MGIFKMSVGSDDYGTLRRLSTAQIVTPTALCGCGARHSYGPGKLSNGADCVGAKSMKRILIKGQPDPYRFVVHATEDCGNDWTLAWIIYPDADNYEGAKILLLDGIRPQYLKELRKLDPHFQDRATTNLPYKVFARFEPTEQGWNAGKHMGKMMAGIQR